MSWISSSVFRAIESGAFHSVAISLGTLVIPTVYMDIRTKDTEGVRGGLLDLMPVKGEGSFTRIGTTSQRPVTVTQSPQNSRL